MRKAYVPDLPKLAFIQEANYNRLQRLLALADCHQVGQSAHFALSSNETETMDVMSVHCIETFPYTSTFQLSLSVSGITHLPLTVRCYHDANMAEVVQVEGACLQQYLGRYDYPNPRMFQPDEKHQLNALLSEWLMRYQVPCELENVQFFSAQVSN